MNESLSDFEREQIAAIEAMEQEQRRHEGLVFQTDNRGVADGNAGDQPPPQLSIEMRSSARQQEIGSERQRRQQLNRPLPNQPQQTVVQRAIDVAIGNRQVQDEEAQIAYIRANRAKVARTSTILACVDVILLAIVAHIHGNPKVAEIEECSPELYSASLGIVIYLLFNFVRNIVVGVSIQFSKSPLQDHALRRLLLICIDCVAMTPLLIWTSFIMGSETALDCKADNSAVNYFWWVNLSVVIFLYFQIFAEWFVCLVACILGCLLGCLYLTMGQLQRQSAIARMQERAPVLSRALNSLQDSKFKDLSQRAKEAQSCVICFEDFKETDDVHQLICDERHVFHRLCLRDWMNSAPTENTLQCPVCRTSVAQPVAEP